MIGVGAMWVLDCYPFLESCKASRVNDIRKVAMYDKDGGLIKPTLNCRIVVSHINHTAKLVATCNVSRMTEFFCDYGDDTLIRQNLEN